MTSDERWLLPRGIDELLPAEARQLERMRRQVLDMFSAWGYELVVTPLAEYLDSLLTGTGNDLNLHTFKITDQLTGRLLGIRPDMTPQVARIDAHKLRRKVPARLCYLGQVLHALPTGLSGVRDPIQVGAELYGYAGLEADVEVILLMLETLRVAGLAAVYVDLNHVGVFSGLASRAGLDDDSRQWLFDALQRKAGPELRDMLGQWNVAEELRALFLRLIELNGEAGEIAAARNVLGGAGPDVLRAVDEVAQVGDAVMRRAPGTNLHFDFAELRGYHYHTGISFSAYAPGQGQGVAWGGRYDGIGAAFGNARPATGFSADLKLLVNLMVGDASAAPPAIFAPAGEAAPLLEAIAELRALGERVIQGLPGQVGDAKDMGCDRILVEKGGRWLVERLDQRGHG